jgi:nicotinamidase-related amidase
MLLEASKASLLLIDVQERLLPAMATPGKVIAQCSILLQAATALALPISISEQYPKGLGHTVSALRGPEFVVKEKLSFSCWRDDTWKQHLIALHDKGRPLVILAGIEAHVCVLQSAIDLANAGFGVFAVTDAMSSRKQASAELAFSRMQANGVQLVNTEMVVFELLQKAGTPMFKTLSALIR